MKNIELYKLLELPDEVEKKLVEYGNMRNVHLPDTTVRKVLNRSEWSEGIGELQEVLGDDPDGIKILWELLNIAGTYSYMEYIKHNISMDIFADTMKFCTRFLKEHYRNFQTYQFIWAWWFPRQISLNEFRIGALEYEFVDEGKREIEIHIPSDADLRKEQVALSLESFYAFRRKYFAAWEAVCLTCSTWMIMPELKEFLGENSNIVSFQNLFEIENVDYEATWYMGWIFPGIQTIDEQLPEKTMLQRKLKQYLLSGKKFGIAKGRLKA